jgi:hypothetical protein
MATLEHSKVDTLSKEEAKTTSSVPTAQSLLVEWANQQDHWIRALVSEAIETRQANPLSSSIGTVW